MARFRWFTDFIDGLSPFKPGRSLARALRKIRDADGSERRLLEYIRITRNLALRGDPTADDANDRPVPERPRRKYDSPEQEAHVKYVLEKRREVLKRLAEGGPDGDPFIHYDNDTANDAEAGNG
jgi:hypothetical protein